MKKYIVGAIVGAALMLSASVYAEDAVLGTKVSGSFPVTINGVKANVPAVVLNINGEDKGFLPIRVIGDALGLDIKFDADLGISVNKAVTKLDQTQETSQISTPSESAIPAVTPTPSASTTPTPTPTVDPTAEAIKQKEVELAAKEEELRRREEKLKGEEEKKTVDDYRDAVREKEKQLSITESKLNQKQILLTDLAAKQDQLFSLKQELTSMTNKDYIPKQMELIDKVQKEIDDIKAKLNQ